MVMADRKDELTWLNFYVYSYLAWTGNIVEYAKKSIVCHEEIGRLLLSAD